MATLQTKCEYLLILNLVLVAEDGIEMLWQQNFFRFKLLLSLLLTPPCPPIDSIMILMTVWRITEKVIRTAILIDMHNYNWQFLQF